MTNNIAISEHMISRIESVMSEMENDYTISLHFYDGDTKPFRKIIETVLQSYQQECDTNLDIGIQKSQFDKKFRLTCGKCSISQFVDGGLMQCPSCGSTENLEMTVANYVDQRPKIKPIVPDEMTPEMMRAVQLHSELGTYAAANMTGAYDLFAEFWRVAYRAATQEEK